MKTEEDFEKLMNDRKAFNEFVYTPMSEALRLLDERRKDPVLTAKIEELLENNIPEFLKNKKCAIMARQLATPNHESRMFINIAQDNDLYPVFFECHDDKFTSNNKYKHSLGQLHIKIGVDKNGKDMVENITIVDFNKYNGSQLFKVKTVWNESLIDFHKKLFTTHNINNVEFLDEKDWHEKGGDETPNEFYLRFFTLNTCFGILFENFLTSNDDRKFTKEVVLPSIEKVINLTGIKPLIIPIGPLEIEVDSLWYHHLSEIKKNIPI